jgi:2-hydroxy-6-oxonona-2,4-dienedioate hydrolase
MPASYSWRSTQTVTIERSARVLLWTAAALATGLTALTLLTYWRDIDAAETRIASGSRIANTPCGPIEYATLGEGPPVLVVHGAGGGFDQGLEFGRPLAGLGYRVIAVSRFGYLRTPMPADASPAAQADAYACLLDALNVPKAAVLGGSAGVHSSLEFCLRHGPRCAAMALLVPALIAARPVTAPRLPPVAPPGSLVGRIVGSDFLFWLNTKIARDLLLERLFATPIRDFENAPPAERERILRVMRIALPMNRRREGLWNDIRIVTSPAPQGLERISAPTIVFAVEDDLFQTYAASRALAARIPGARFIGFPTGGHLWVGREDELVSRLVAFLRTSSDSAWRVP